MSGAAQGEPLRNETAAFLHFCRLEKGLAVNTLAAYARDLQGLGAFLGP